MAEELSLSDEDVARLKTLVRAIVSRDEDLLLSICDMPPGGTAGFWKSIDDLGVNPKPLAQNARNRICSELLDGNQTVISIHLDTEEQDREITLVLFKPNSTQPRFKFHRAYRSNFYTPLRRKKLKPLGYSEARLLEILSEALSRGPMSEVQRIGEMDDRSFKAMCGHLEELGHTIFPLSAGFESSVYYSPPQRDGTAYFHLPLNTESETDEELWVWIKRERVEPPARVCLMSVYPRRRDPN